MSATVDNRIVQLEMDDQQFEREAEKSIQTLDKLKEAMKFEDAAKNLSSLSDAAGKLNFTNVIAEKIDESQSVISSKLSTWKLGIASAIGNIASGLFGDLVIDPIKQSIQGGITRSQNIADAKFQLEGLGIAWENVKKDIDYAVDGTAYGLDVAAKAASQLSASGVQLGDDMKAALRGISGVAAMGATEYENVTPIFTKAAGQGRVMADELNRISQFGLNAAAQLAKFFNTIDDSNAPEELKKQVKELTKGLNVGEKEIRDFASHSEISFEMFAYAMDEAFGEHAKDANKTFTGALSNMKAALNRIGEQFRAPIMDAAIPVFNELRNMINSIKTLLTDSGIFDIWQKLMALSGKLLSSGIGKVTKFLTNDFTGATNVSNGLYNILYSITKVLDTVKHAFFKVFGRDKDSGIGSVINSLAESFEKLTQKILPTDVTLEKIKTVMEAFFTVVKKGIDVLTDLIDKYGNLIGVVAKAVAIFLALKGVMGFFAAHPAIRMFTILATVIPLVVKAVKYLVANWDSLKTRMTSTYPILNTIVEKLKTFGNFIKAGFTDAMTIAARYIEKFVNNIKMFKFEDLKIQFVRLKGLVVDFIEKLRDIPIVGRFVDNLKTAFDGVVRFITKAKDVITSFFVSATGNSSLLSKTITKDMSTIEKAGTILLNVFKTIGVVLGGTVLGAMELFNKGLAALKSLSIEGIVAKLREVVESVKNLSIFDKVQLGLSVAGDKIVAVLNTIIDRIKEFMARLRSGDYSLDGFADKINGVIEIVTTFKEKLVEAFSGGEVTRGGAGGGPLGQFMQALGDKMTWLKGVFTDGFNKIQENGLLTKVLMIGYVLAILKVLLTFASTTKKIGEAVTSSATGITGAFSSMADQFGIVGQILSGVITRVGGEGGLLDLFFGGITKSLQDFAEAQKRTPMEQFVGVLKSLAIVIAVVAASLAILSSIDSNKLITAAIVLGVLSGALVLVAGIMAKIADTVKEGSTYVGQFQYVLLALAAAVGILTIVIFALSNIDWGKAIPGFIGLLGVIGALYLVTKAMDKLDTSGATIKGAVVLLALAVMLRALTKSLVELVQNAEAFANLDPKALYAMGGLIIAFGVLCALAGNVDLGSAIASIIMLAVFKKFMDALAEFAKTDYSKIVEYLYAARGDIATAIMVIIAITSITRLLMKAMTLQIAKLAFDIGKAIALAGAGFLAFAVGTLVMVAAIKKLSKLDLDIKGVLNVIAGLVLISAMFVGLLVASKHFAGADKGFLAVAAAFALLGLAAMQIAITAKILRKVEWENLGKALVIFASICVLMGLLILAAKANDNNMGMKSLIAIVAGMTLMFGELLILSVMVSNPTVYENIKKACLVLFGIMAAFGYVLYAAGSIESSKGVGMLLGIILALGAVFAALWFLSQQIKSIEDLIGLGAIAAILIVSVGALVHLAKSFFKFAKASNAGQGKWVGKALAMLGIMIGAFAAVAGVLIAASKLTNFKEIGPLALVLCGALVAVTYAAKLMLNANKKMKWNEFAKMAATLGVMLVAMTLIAGIVMAITKLQNGQLTRAGGGDSILSSLLPILAVLEILVLIANQASKMDGAKMLKAALGLTAMTAIFAALALIAGLLNQFGGDATSMLAKTQSVILVLVELTVMLAILGAISTLAATAMAALPALIAITAIFAALALIAGLLNQFGGDAGDMLAKTQVVSLVLLELVVITGILGLLSPLAVNAIAALPGLIVMTAIFAALALIAGLLNQFGGDAGDMLAKTQVVSLVLLELVVITAILGLLSPLAAAALAAVPGLLGVVAVLAVLALIGAAIGGLDLTNMQSDMDLLTTILWKLVAIVAVLGLLSVGAVGELAGAAAILMICAALVPLTNALRNLEGVNIDMIADGIQKLSSAFGAMVAVAAGVAIMGAGLIVLAAGITAVGAACLIAATGVQAFAMALMMLVAAAVPVVAAIKEIGTQMYEGFKEKIDKIKELPGDLVKGITEKIGSTLGSLKDAGKKMGDSLINAFRDAVGWHSPVQFLIKFFQEAGVTVNQNAKSVDEIFDGTGNSWGSALEQALTNKLGSIDLKSIGKMLGIDLGNSALAGAIPGLSSIKTYIDGIFGSKKAEEAELIRLMSKGQIASAEFDSRMKALYQTTEKTDGSILDLTNGLGGLTDGLGKAGGAAKSAKDEFQEFHDSLQQTLESQMNIFQKFEEKAAMSKEELLSNMQSQITGMTNWASNMDKLSTMGIDKGLYQKLAEMGPEGAEYVGAFVNMTADEMARANDLWAQSLVLPGNVANQLSADWSGISTEMVNGLSKGWTDTEGQFHDNILTTSQNAQKEFKEDNGIASPARKYIQMGFYLVLGLRKGIIDNRQLAVTAIQQVARLTINAAEEMLNADTLYNVGASMSSSLARGISENASAVDTAISALKGKIQEAGAFIAEGLTLGIEENDDKPAEATNKMGKKLNKKFEKTEEIESPSKVFYRYGKYIAQGLANGINAYSSLAVVASEDMADESIDAMRYTVATIAATLQNGVEDPVITPVLDLSQINAGIRTINSAFSTSQAMNVSGSMSNLQNGQSSVGGINFIQNNYSPKALSRTDIYRQTNNQLTMLRRVAVN